MKSIFKVFLFCTVFLLLIINEKLKKNIFKEKKILLKIKAKFLFFYYV